MEGFTQTGKWLLAAALTSGLWLSQSACAPPAAQAQSRRPGLGLPPPDDNQKQREEERKREDDRKAEEQRKQDDSRRQDAERRQQEQARQEQQRRQQEQDQQRRQQEQAQQEQVRRQQEQSRQEQQRRQQEQSQQETRRRQQEQDALRSQQEQARQEQQRRQHEQAAQEQRRSDQERARRDAELRQREQDQQEAQRRQQEQAQAEARRRQQEPRERLIAQEGAAPSRRPSLFQNPPPINTPRTTTTTPPQSPPPTTRGNERAPADNPRSDQSAPSPRSVGVPGPSGNTGTPSSAPPSAYSGGRRPSFGNPGNDYGRTLPQPSVGTPSGPATVSPSAPTSPNYSGRTVIIDRSGRRTEPGTTRPQVPPDYRQPSPIPGTAVPSEPTRRSSPSDEERYRSRGPSLYQGTVRAPYQNGDGRDRQGNRPGDSQRSSELWRDRFRNGGGRHGTVLPVDRYRNYDHVCDRRCRDTRHYDHRCDGSCRHRRYDYGSPYGPVIVPIYVPVPEPTIIYEPRTEVVIVPRAPEPAAPPAPRSPERAYSDRLAEPMPLEDVIADIEAAWERGNLDLLMRHVSPERSVEIFERGALLYKLDRDQFGQRNLDAFRRYQTAEMRFGRPELLSDTEAVATGTHRFRDDQDQERRVRVIYAFHKEGAAWRLAGVDFSRDEEEEAAAPAAAQPVAEPVAAAEEREVSLLWSQKIALSALLGRSQPLRVATLHCRVAGAEANYDLEAMRGIVPNTIAWALYHRGEQVPVETGTADVSGLNPGAWFKLQLLTAADAGPILAAEHAHAAAAALPLQWLASEQVLALHETEPPVVKKPAAAPKPATIKKSTGAKRPKRHASPRVAQHPRPRPAAKT